MQEFIKENGRKYYRAVCSRCGKDRGYKRYSYINRGHLNCRSCWQSKIDIHTDYIINSKGQYRYKAYCIKCGADRGYKSAHVLNRLCVSCSQSKGNRKPPSLETRLKIGMKSKGRKHTEEAKIKIGNFHLGKAPGNKGKHMTMESRVKLACYYQNIDVKDFKGFKKSREIKERHNLGSEVKKKCYKLYNYKCDYCNSKDKLNAHHLDNFANFPDKRLDINNLVCLCKKCHETFHRTYGYRKTIKEDYEDFKKEREVLNFPFE